MTLKIDARPMVMSMTTNSKDKAVHLKNFLRTANANKLQGPAIISYFTEVNKLERNRKQLTKETLDRFEKLPNLIEQEACKDPELKQESSIFINSLQKMYPRTLDTRISLASEGAVVSDKVKPKSMISKFFTAINRVMFQE